MTHNREHRQEREGFNGLVESITKEIGATVTIDEPEE
jgi:hypothetical protein